RRGWGPRGKARAAPSAPPDYCASFSRKPLPPPTVTIAFLMLCFQPIGSVVRSATARATSWRAWGDDRLPIAQIWYAPLSSTKLSIRALPPVTRYSGWQGVPTVSPPPAVTLAPACGAPSSTTWATRKPTPLVFWVTVFVLTVSSQGYGSGLEKWVLR